MPVPNPQPKNSRKPTPTPTSWLSEEEVILERMRAFHQQRVDAIQKREKPFCLGKGGTLIVHLIPVAAVRSSKMFNASELKEHGQHICPLGERGGNPRFNADGFVNCDSREDLRAYMQLYRDGRLEAAMATATFKEETAVFLRDTLCERAVINVVGQYIKCCNGLQVQPPVWLFTSLVDVEGVSLFDNYGHSEYSIDRSVVHLPETQIVSFGIDAPMFLRPLFDCMWNALGAECSWNYDEAGNRHERRR